MNGSIKKILAVTPLKITIFVIFIALVLFALDAPFLRFMELKALDLRMVSRGTSPAGGETLIVAIDEKSLGELGRWPWPRTTIARLVDVLKGYGAKAVGFDIVFAEPEGDSDAALARTIERAGNVTLGYFFHITGQEVGHLTREQIAAGQESIASSRFPTVRAEAGAGEAPLLRAYAAQPNIPALSGAARNSGFFNSLPDSDGVIRWSPLVIRHQGQLYTSLALSLIHQYLDRPDLILNVADYGVEGIRLGREEIPTDESGRLLVNYLGPGNTFPHHSVCDVLAGRVKPETFRGKIVLVGATATGIYDMRVTPHGSVYPGVEIHANVIDNILHRHFLIHSGWTRLLDVGAIVVMGLVMGIAIPRMKALGGIVLFLALMGAFVAGNTAIFIRYSLWLNLVYPLLTMIAIYLGIAVYRYVTEEREKKKIRGAFQYYLNASVVAEILKDPSKLKLGGDRRNLSVMFSDIRGFTSISEKLSPEELVHLLNEYLTAMTDIVFKYDGLLDKYIGDAIMAEFGAPIDQPDHALRACRTGIGMIGELERLRKKWSAEGRPEVAIGVGINTGDMVVGNMGSQMRFDYTVMGDSVNLASRLEGANKEYGTMILISESTHERVRDELFCREIDAVRVKGKERPVRIFELLGEKGDAARWQAFAVPFERGLARYRACQWDEAIRDFNEVLEIKPDDGPARLYIERCEAFKACPPPEGEWDGVCTMTRK